MRNIFSDALEPEVKCIGFDLDGTMYWEYQFIVQAYKGVAEYISLVGKKDKEAIYKFMLKNWEKKGSSYSNLFQDALFFSEAEISDKNIKECILAYRNTIFELTLSQAVEQILDYCMGKYELFIVTDGNVQLQNKKIEELGLEKWFCSENIFITGQLGKDAYKPSTLVLKDITCIHKYRPSEICYCGDRKVDYDFACNAGFHFIEMKSTTEKGNIEIKKVR